MGDDRSIIALSMLMNRGVALLSLVLVCVVLGRTQTGGIKNPLEGDPKAIEQGRTTYARRCAVCHGMDARGYRGIDLTTGDYPHGTSDADLFRAITRGIPGTEMLGAAMDETEVWTVISYLRTLVAPRTPGEERGDAIAGERLFWGKASCGQCHMVAGRGGRLGPDLSRIGAARSRAALLREIRTASASFAPGYEPVTAVTREGRKIRGCRKNEDAFSIQLMDAGERLLSFWKKDLQEMVEENESLMPDYGPGILSDVELDDLLRYLATLRGAKP